MLRSLVGSEMCIRDRCEAGRARFGISDIDLVETLFVSVFQVFIIKYLLKNPSSLTLRSLMQRNDSTVVTLAQVETY